MPRPLIATIDIGAMRSNLALARARAPGARTWAIVKANAYGHQLANALRAFTDSDGMALVEFDGAAELRALGWKRPVLMLEGAFDAEDLELAARLELSLAVHCEDQLRMIETATLPRPLGLHLKINTGMNRLGFRPGAIPAAHARLQASRNVRSIAFITHLANADSSPQHACLPASLQADRFKAATAGFAGESSIANSAANLLIDSLSGQWIRPGIMLYGGSPGEGTGLQFGLQPAMTLSSRIIGVQEVAAGESVGYGSRFIAQKPTRIGVVACGYADGYPRSAPDGTPVLVDGIRVPMAGRVSMDMITVDLTAAPRAGVGSEVTLWGRELSIDEVAQASGTIGYELMCALARRVRVRAVDQG